jgi:choline dehydrogenase
MAVVDEKLRVHGVANLWVGDASIMPVVSHANTNLTSIMIGERLADFVKEVA